ncbi:hypothetical protein [Desulfopila sp. IMCC35008]|uniref:hypothetical protein n=1 Tax=Desulfopila sp. IMCC35008 TaxID=2653858 RepID=UPI0013CF4505|nr:hypothetical protein [Desulfopila sp. IMCC35008]
MGRILNYARTTGFTEYTSTLKEAWRLSISGLTSSIVLAKQVLQETPELTPDFDFQDNPIAHFGVVEAQRHRERGIDLAMFLSLFKYYRRAYRDVILEKAPTELDKNASLAFLDRTFDIIEIAFTVEWSGRKEDANLRQLQVMNRQMTNEKNKYLTIFESLPSPAFLVNSDGSLDNMNLMATSYFNPESTSGGYYYRHSEQQTGETDTESHESAEQKRPIGEILPWLTRELELFMSNKLETPRFIKHVDIYKKEYTFVVRLSEMFDVSRKFNGAVIILEDITRLKQVESDFKKLAGFIPICSHCKNIRDDKGAWNKLEEFIEQRSEALFSHSICDTCLEKHYGPDDESDS